MAKRKPKNHYGEGSIFYSNVKQKWMAQTGAVMIRITRFWLCHFASKPIKNLTNTQSIRSIL